MIAIAEIRAVLPEANPHAPPAVDQQRRRTREPP